ncbi:MAG: hypothetical protein V3573_08915 [Desulfovibrionaceae bacterium]
MRPALFLALLATLFLAPLTGAKSAQAQNKFENKDTAKNRQDSIWGTRTNEGRSYFGTDGYGDSAWGYQPDDPEKPVDWYDKIIIAVDPNVDWPPDGETSTTSTRIDSSTGGVDTNSTTTTTTTTAPN